MSDLAATNCGCGCDNNGCNNGCGCSNWIWIILLLACCGNGNGCGSGYGFGNDSCCWIILLLLFCGNGNNFLGCRQWLRQRMRAADGSCRRGLRPAFFYFTRTAFFRFSQDRSVVPYSFFPVSCFLSAAAPQLLSPAFASHNPHRFHKTHFHL